MGRRTLQREIAAIDARVDQRRKSLARSLERTRRQVRAVHPAWWLGGGLAAGYLLGRQGFTVNVHRARTGLSLLSMLRSLGLSASLL